MTAASALDHLTSRPAFSRPAPNGRAPVTPLRPRPEVIAGRLAQAIAEVLVRARPANQLEPVATQSVVRLLERRADQPVLATVSEVARPRVASLRVSAPTAGAVEACAVLAVGERRRALAFRLELDETGWRCVAVQVG